MRADSDTERIIRGVMLNSFMILADLSRYMLGGDMSHLITARGRLVNALSGLDGILSGARERRRRVR